MVKEKGEDKMVENNGKDKMLKEDEGVTKAPKIVAEFRCKRCGHTVGLTVNSLKTPPYKCSVCGVSRVIKTRKVNEDTGEESIRTVSSFEIKKI